MIGLRDHGRLIDLGDQGWILQLEDVAYFLELRLTIVELMSDELVSEDNVLLNGVHLAKLELERKLL